MKFSEILYCLRGFSTPVGGISWNPPAHHRDIAQRLMTFLYDRRVLHVPSEAESPTHVIESVLQIRRELTSLAQQLSPRSKLELKLRAMRGACIHFLNRVQKNEAIIRHGNQSGHWANWEFIDSLGQWRAFMAVYLGSIAASYEVEPPAFLLGMLPEIPKPDRVAERSSSDDGLRALIDRFAALPPYERRRQIEATNRYLASAEGQREFGHRLPDEAPLKDAASEQGLHK